MQVVIGILRLLLCVVFAVAGVAKVRNLNESRKAMRDFGLPDAFAMLVGTVLPFAELVIAVALLPAVTSRWAAIAASGFLLLFCVEIAINLARGRKPDCHCFGQLQSEPIGASTILRNFILAAAAGLIAWTEQNHPPPSLVDTFSGLVPMQGVVVLMGGVAACLLFIEALFIIHLARQNGRLLLRIEALESGLAGSGRMLAAAPHAGLPIGTMAPSFQLPDLTGKTTSLKDLCAQSKTLLLMFIDPQCATCKSLLPDMARWSIEHSETMSLVLISRGAPHENRYPGPGLENVPVLLQQAHEVAGAYGIHGTPGAMFVRSDGAIGSAGMVGTDAIRKYVLGGAHEQKVSVPRSQSGRCRSCHQAKAGLPMRPGEPDPGIALPGPSSQSQLTQINHI